MTGPFSIGVREDGSEIAAYCYDTLNRRTNKYLTGLGGTIYLYDGWQCVEERDADGELLRRYVYGAHYLDELVATVEDSSLTFYLQDSNYNVVALADEDAHVTERYWYEPYGEVTITDADGGTQETVLNDVLLFQGQRRDPETGLYYFRNRYYSAVLGRFAQRDPAGYSQAFSLYVAVRVILYTDPYGLESFFDKLLKSLPGKGEFQFGGEFEFGSGAGKIPKFEWGAPVESTSLPSQVEKAVKTVVKNALEDVAPVSNDPLYEMAEKIADVVYGPKGWDQIGKFTAPGQEGETVGAAKTGALIAAMIIASLEMTKGPDGGAPRQPKWQPGDDIYAPTQRGTEPSDRTVGRRFWKNEAENPSRPDYKPEDVETMRRGEPPQRYNEEKGGHGVHGTLSRAYSRARSRVANGAKMAPGA